MSTLGQAKTKRLLAVHGWSGTVLGLLLYVCVFSGSIVVFEDEIDTWAQGIVEHHDTLGARVDHHFRVAARDVDRRYYEDVQIFRLPDGNMQYLFHTHETDAETGRIVEPTVHITVDGESGVVVDRWEGLRGEHPPAPGSALRDFWVDLHVQLYLPNPYGLILVGALGLMMMAAAISGILIHKHLFRDAFVSARNRTRLVGARDLHVLAGSWGLPFALILAFTGAFFGFAGPVGVPMMAQAAFKGDRQALIETVVGVPEEVDMTAAPLASLDYIIADAENRSSGEIQFIQITNYDSADAKVRLRVSPPVGELAPVVLGYEGVTRAFEGEKPIFGQSPSFGASVFGIIGPLHFGNFAGLVSKTVWLGMGLAMAFVTASGLLLWTKRREDEPLWRGFRRVVMLAVWGVPFAMLVSAVVFFVTLPAGDPHVWTPMGVLLGGVIAVTRSLRGQVTVERLRIANASRCLTLPLLRHLTGGSSWSEALIGGGLEILVIDILLILTGLALLHKARKTSHEPQPSAVQEPAE